MTVRERLAAADRATYQAQLKALEAQAVMLAMDIASLWRRHASAMRKEGFHKLAPVHVYEGRLRGILAECERLRRKLRQ